MGFCQPASGDLLDKDVTLENSADSSNEHFMLRERLNSGPLHILCITYVAARGIIPSLIPRL